MDPFDKLPLELLVEITKQVPDLPSLHSLCCASPRIDALLRDDKLAAEIVEKIMTASLSSCNVDLVRTICKTIWQRPSTWEAFLALNCVHPHLRGLDRASLPEDTPASATRRLLALSASVYRAAHRLTAGLFWRCLNVPVELQLPVEQTDAGDGDDADADRLNQEAIAAPLMWAERERIVRLVLIMALYSVLLDIGGRSFVHVDAERERADPLINPQFMWFSLGCGCGQDFLALHTFIDIDKFDYAPESPAPAPMAMRVADVFPDALETTPYWPSFDEVQPMPSGWDPGECGRGNVQGRSSIAADPALTLKCSDWHLFMYFGAAVWEKWRLEAMGLVLPSVTPRPWLLPKTCKPIPT